MAPSRYDWKIVDWDVKPQHNQPTNSGRKDEMAQTSHHTFLMKSHAECDYVSYPEDSVWISSLVIRTSAL